MGGYDRIYFAQPHQLHAVLGKVPNKAHVYIADLGLNNLIMDKVINQLRRIISSGGIVKWFDHHLWDEDWIKSVKSVGVELYVDRSTCAAGVVAKYLGVKGEGVNELVKAACSLDLWRFDFWLGSFLGKIVGFRGGSKWKEYVVRRLINFKGSLDDDLLAIVEEEVSKELRLFSQAIRKALVKNFKDIKLIGYFKGNEEHVTSYIAHILLSRFNADIAVICRNASISLRSKRYNVRELAKILGGGGHPQAAGAPLRPPIYIRILSMLGLKRLHLNWCLNKVIEGLRSLGGHLNEISE